MLRIGSLLSRMAGLTISAGSTGLPSAVRAVAAPQQQSARTASFLVRISGDDLWKSVTSVSNAGRKRGRASGHSRKTAKDLNRGQRIGEGRINMVWPGLNAPVLRGKEIVERQQLPPDPERQERLIAIRNKQQGSFRRVKLTSLERGWTGTRAPGRSLGPPDPVGTANVKDFDSVVLELKLVNTMTGHLGRVRRHKAVVAVGNGKGLLGFGIARAPEGRIALRKAKNKAFLRLCHYPMFENHTVTHDFIAEYGCTRIQVRKKQRGYGLVAHRAITSICKLIGIKNLYAKVDTRNTHLLNLMRAFLIGLQKQKTHQELADEKRLHVVEFRPERLYFPNIIASPTTGPVRTEGEVNPHEELDINMIVSDGRLLKEKRKLPPFYTRLPCWEVHLKKTDLLKNQRQVRMRLIKKYGSLKSFLNVRDEQKLPLNQFGANGEMV